MIRQTKYKHQYTEGRRKNNYSVTKSLKHKTSCFNLVTLFMEVGHHVI